MYQMSYLARSIGIEINKLTFESLENVNTDKTFDELDVNKDRVINNLDATATTDVNLAKDITSFLASVNEDWIDDEVPEKSGCYQTCTPLAFYIEHDGITTTKETINYDIDSDGKINQ